MTVDTRAPGEFVLTCYRCGDQTAPRSSAGEARRAGKRAGWGRSYPKGRGESFVCPRCKQGAPFQPPAGDLAGLDVCQVEAWSFSWDDEFAPDRGWFTLVKDGEPGDEWQWISYDSVSTWSTDALVEYLREPRPSDADEPAAYVRALRIAADVVERSARRAAMAS